MDYRLIYTINSEPLATARFHELVKAQKLAALLLHKYAMALHPNGHYCSLSGDTLTSNFKIVFPIGARRNKFGYTQTEWAQQLGVSRALVSQWERGLRYPQKPVLILLAYVKPKAMAPHPLLA